MGLVLLIAVSSTHALLTTNRIAARNRVMTAARAVVQRNIDAALSVAWTTPTPPDVEPTILQITPAAGSAYDDDSGGTNNMVNLITLKNTSGDLIILQGTLTRVVTAVTNSTGADIRRITFRLTYKYLNTDYTVEMSTFRTIDD